MKKFYILAMPVLPCMLLHAQHPWLLKDINQTGTSATSPVGTSNSYPNVNIGLKYFYKVNGVAVFFADDGIHGQELWVTNGTTSSTNLLLDITPGATGTVFSSVYEAGTLLYFTTLTNGNNTILWRTDGTASGTFQLMANASGKHNILSANNDFNDGYQNTATKIGNSFFFIVIDTLSPIFYNNRYYTNNHYRVYKTDGTVAGTSVYFDGAVYVNNNGQTQTGIQKIIAVGSTIYLDGYTNTTDFTSYYNNNPNYLMAGDGTNAPTIIYNPGGQYGVSIDEMVNVNNNYLLINGRMGNGAHALYRLKPTETTPVFLQSTITGNASLISLYPLHSEDLKLSSLYFFRNDNVGKSVTNGEPSGTFALSGMANTLTYFTGIVNNKMTFKGDDGKIYFWDGLTPTSWQLVSDSLSNQRIQKVLQVGNKVFYFNDQNNPVQTSDIDGSNCLTMYAYSSNGLGTVYNNYILDYFSYSRMDGSFDAGSEPSSINANFKIFTGAVSNNWNTAGNWSPSGIPTATDNVVIAALPAAKLPVISANATCNNLTICKSMLTIYTGTNLDVNGYVANFKSNIIGSGAVTIKGNAATKLYGHALGSDGYGTVYPNMFDVANVNINGVDVGFSNSQQTINSVVNFQTDNKIVAPYTSVTFGKSHLLVATIAIAL